MCLSIKLTKLFYLLLAGSAREETVIRRNRMKAARAESNTRKGKSLFSCCKGDVNRRSKRQGERSKDGALNSRM